MSYLGNAPARSFISFERQVFTIVNSQTAYTLSHSVTNENDIRLVVNNVVQEPGSGKAYTATGTALTLSAALTNGTDEMYCVFLGRATATSAPGAGSIGTAQLAADAVTNAKIADDAISDEQLDPTVITGQTAEATIATDDLILLSDTSASGALRKMTRANFVSGVGGTLVPAFSAFNASTQNISDATITKCRFNTEILDSSGKYDSSTNYRFTPASTGYYLINANVSLMSNSGADLMLDNYIWIYENNAQIAISQNYGNSSNRDSWGQHNLSCIVHSDNANDYYEIFAYADMSSGTPEVAGHASRQFSSFNAFKLIL